MGSWMMSKVTMRGCTMTDGQDKVCAYRIINLYHTENHTYIYTSNSYGETCKARRAWTSGSDQHWVGVRANNRQKYPPIHIVSTISTFCMYIVNRMKTYKYKYSTSLIYFSRPERPVRGLPGTPGTWTPQARETDVSRIFPLVTAIRRGF
jgi:hypothetical protein